MDVRPQRHAISTEQALTFMQSTYSAEGISFTIGPTPNDYHITCSCCPAFNISVATTASWALNVKQHVEVSASKNTENHFHRNLLFKGQMKISAWLALPKPVLLEDFENPHLAAQCLGYRLLSGSAEEQMAMNLQYREGLEFEITLRQSPVIVAATPGKGSADVVAFHTVHSIHCQRSSPFNDRPLPDHICIYCDHVPNLAQFKNEVAKRTKGLSKYRAYQDDHIDNIIQRAKDSSAEAQKYKRKAVAFAKRCLRSNCSLAKTLKVHLALI